MKYWKVSAGTAGLIGGRPLKSDAPPTTGYIMLGGHCRNNCRFCAQARSSKAGEGRLSRITWPALPEEAAAEGIAGAYQAGRLKRACLQVVDSGQDEETAAAVARLRGGSGIPVCVSSHLDTLEQAEKLLSTGADRICIALDGATPAVYEAVKEGNWQQQWELLLACADAFPGQVTTHLIVGLGETEAEMADRLTQCVGQGITVGLFAFTPVKGTAWQERSAPPVAVYRRLQIVHHLLRLGYGRKAFQVEKGRIVRFTLPETAALLADGKAFQTSGCPDCNRPYYNERPGGVMYNYPRPLRPDEVAAAIRECEIIGNR